MWYVMENAQSSYMLSDRLIRAISNWRISPGSDDDVENLIENGADVNKLHGTLLPLHCACMVSDSYILRLLLQKGARCNEIDGYGRAALHYAAERDIFCVEILLENGANINIGDGNQDTPLHWATFKNNLDCVKILLQRGAEVDAEDFNSDTPLSWAARKGHFEIINILLEYNADTHSMNFKDNTPLLQAATIQATGLNTDMDDRCLELLLRATAKFHLSSVQKDAVKRDNKLSELLLPRSTNPCSLQGQCRYNIRRALGYRYLPNVIPKLPVPQRVKDYIALKS